MSAIKWRLENPQVGQEVAICDKHSGEPYNVAKIVRLTGQGRVRTNEAGGHGNNLYEPPYGFACGYSSRLITNDPTAIAIVRDKQAERAKSEAQRKAAQEAKEADPRWPVAVTLCYSGAETQDHIFKRLAVLTSDELAQLKTLLEKVYR